jgi:hypothetical protein
MESPKAQCRLDAILHAYLEDLAKLGTFGRGKSGVMRRLIEQGVQRAIESNVIAKRSIEDFGGTVADQEDDGA